MSAYRQALPKRGTGKHRVMRFAMSLVLSMTCVRAIAQELPKVAVLSTGGTIASRQDPIKGGYVPVLSAEDLVAAVPAIKKIAQIQAEQISNIPSQDMAPEIWLRLAARGFRGHNPPRPVPRGSAQGTTDARSGRNRSAQPQLPS